MSIVTLTQLRYVIVWFLTALLIPMMIYGLSFLTPLVAYTELNTGANWIMLSMLLFGLVLILKPGITYDPLQGEQRESPSIRARHRIAILFGAILLLIAAEISGNWLNAMPFPKVNYHLQFALWSGGISAITWGLCAGVRWPKLDHDLLILIGLFVIGLMIRGYQMMDTRVFIDEVLFTVGIRDLWKPDGRFGLFQPFSSVGAFPFVYSYGQTIAIDLYGRNLLAMRSVSVLFGAVSIPALYFMARQFVAPRVAVLAALLLLTFPPHLMWSQIGLNNITDSVFGVLAIGFTARGLRQGARVDFVLAGVMLGLSQYFYEAGRLIFPALIGGWIGFTFLFYRAQVCSKWRGVILLIVTAAIIGGPIYYTLIGRDLPLFARFSSTGQRGVNWRELPIDQQRDTALRLLRSAGMIVIAEPERILFYGGDTPVLLIVIVPWVALGLAFAIRFSYRPEGVLWVVWAVAPTMISTLFSDTISTARMINSFPVWMLLAAIGIDQVSRRLTTERAGKWIGGLTVALIVGIQFWYFFQIHQERFMTQHYRMVPGQEAAFITTTLPSGTNVFLFEQNPYGASAARGIIDFMRQGLRFESFAPDAITPAFFAGLDTDERNIALIVAAAEPETAATVELMRQRWPEVPINAIEWENRYTPFKRYTLYFIPRGSG